jgi:Protein of unknown function (DUF2721)
MTLDIEGAPNKEEIRATKEEVRKRLSLWRERALYSTASFFLSCALVYLFLAGQVLHGYWMSVGRWLLLLSMAMLLVCVYCVALWWGAWTLFRDLEKTYTTEE